MGKSSKFNSYCTIHIHLFQEEYGDNLIFFVIFFTYLYPQIPPCRDIARHSPKNDAKSHNQDENLREILHKIA